MSVNESVPHMLSAFFYSSREQLFSCRTLKEAHSVFLIVPAHRTRDLIYFTLFLDINCMRYAPLFMLYYYVKWQGVRYYGYSQILYGCENWVRKQNSITRIRIQDKSLDQLKDCKKLDRIRNKEVGRKLHPFSLNENLQNYL
jgi:hypothetical protein